jgi:hypothetical protein
MGHDRDIDLKPLPIYVSQNRCKRYDSFMRRCLSDILLNIDDDHLLEAENWLMQAIELDKNHDAKSELGMDYVLYAELFKRKGDRSKTKELLGKAIELLRECGADGWVKRYEEELAGL